MPWPRFQEGMRERLEAFTLSPHPEKTRLIEFGRFAAPRAHSGESANRRPLSGLGPMPKIEKLAYLAEQDV
jgi:hypothetical protein